MHVKARYSWTYSTHLQLDILNTFTVGHTQHIYSWTYSTHLQLDILNTFTVGHTQHIYSWTYSTHLQLSGLRQMTERSKSRYNWIYSKTTQIMKKSLLPQQHGLLFPISSKGSFICTITQKGFLYQLWSTGWNEN